MTRPKPDPEKLFVVKPHLQKSYLYAVFFAEARLGDRSRVSQWTGRLSADSNRECLIAAYECGWRDHAEWIGAEKPL